MDCDPEIGRYYRHLYQRDTYNCHKLSRPFWGAHVTLVRNEEPDVEHKHLWDAYAGEAIEFHYCGPVKDNYSKERYRSFYWVDVFCPRMDEIRKELGLGVPSCGYHLTVGSSENEARKDWYLTEFRSG